MNPNTVDPSKLFSVEGMVVLVTGGATGEYMQTTSFTTSACQGSSDQMLRNWLHDHEGLCEEWSC